MTVFGCCRIEFDFGTTLSQFHFDILYSFICYLLRRCLHDTGRVSFRYDFILVPWFVYTIPTKILFRNESFKNELIPVIATDRTCRYGPQVSCKWGTSSFRYRTRQVDWLGWSADWCFRSADVLLHFDSRMGLICKYRTNRLCETFWNENHSGIMSVNTAFRWCIQYRIEFYFGTTSIQLHFDILYSFTWYLPRPVTGHSGMCSSR